MRHLLPFIGGGIGAAIGAAAFPGSVPSNQMLYALLGGGGAFLFLGFSVWVLPLLPPPTPEQLQRSAWADSWTPPAPVYQEDLYVQHQRHLQEQARMGWLMGDPNYPPTDWFGR